MTTSATILLTERLRLRELTDNDADFIVTLLNDPDFLSFIGDRGVRNYDDAIAYLHNGPIKSYRDNGFGLYLVQELATDEPVGICGLVSRDGLDAPDLGFALLPVYRSLGYALEASQAVLDYGFSVLDIERVLAIVAPGNRRSTALLEKLGMVSSRMIRLQKDSEDLHLFELMRPET